MALYGRFLIDATAGPDPERSFAFQAVQRQLYTIFRTPSIAEDGTNLGDLLRNIRSKATEVSSNVG